LQSKKKNKVISISLSISIIAHIIAIVIYVAFFSKQKEQNTDAILVEMLKVPLQRSIRQPRHKPRIITKLHPLEENHLLQKLEMPNVPFQITSESMPSTYAALEWDNTSYIREPVKAAKFTMVKLNTLPVAMHLVKTSMIRPFHKVDDIFRNNWNFDMQEHLVELDIGKIEADFFLNTRQDELSAFQAKIREKIEQAKEYPPLARKKGFEGVVQLTFCILQDGTVKEVIITKPSEYEMLNNAAVETIKRGQPYPEIPKTLHKTALWIELSIVFDLKEKS
jgi:TonB family protein